MLTQAKRALLAMQRHSWEQGVAMQAFWELGDEDVVLAMAKEAAYRRREEICRQLGERVENERRDDKIRPRAVRKRGGKNQHVV